MNNSSFCSNESSDYEINNDTLDKLYREQLQTLRDLVLKQNQTNDLVLCRKWLKVFGKTTKSEKIARNCLCSLMYQQLQEFGFLDSPFTDLQNCNRDLNFVLRQLDDKNQSTATEQTETIESFESHHKPELYNQKTDLTKDDNTISECLENETLAENAVLRHELEMMRLQLTEKQIENIKLKEIAAKYQLENIQHLEKFNNLKSTFRKAIEELLKDLNAEQNLSINTFERVFKNFSDDPDFSSEIKKFDSNFEIGLNKIFETELNKRKTLIASHISRKFAKNKKKLKEKYDRRLRVQGWAQRLQLKLVKLKCFSVLRQIFINTQNGKSDTMWEILQVLEEKYQDIVNEIL